MIVCGFPLLVVIFAWTTWDSGARLVWWHANPVSWGFGSFFIGLRDSWSSGPPAMLQRLVAFYRSDPWGNWVLVDHLGLKVFLSFFLWWDAHRSRRTATLYIVSMYVVGAIALCAYFWRHVDPRMVAGEPHLDYYGNRTR